MYGSLWSPINLVAIFIQKNGWQKTSQVLDLLSSVFSASHVKSSHVQVQEYLISSESQKWAFLLLESGIGKKKWRKWKNIATLFLQGCLEKLDGVKNGELKINQDSSTTYS